MYNAVLLYRIENEPKEVKVTLMDLYVHVQGNSIAINKGQSVSNFSYSAKWKPGYLLPSCTGDIIWTVVIGNHSCGIEFPLIYSPGSIGRRASGQSTCFTHHQSPCLVGMQMSAVSSRKFELSKTSFQECRGEISVCTWILLGALSGTGAHWIWAKMEHPWLLLQLSCQQLKDFRFSTDAASWRGQDNGWTISKLSSH